MEYMYSWTVSVLSLPSCYHSKPMMSKQTIAIPLLSARLLGPRQTHGTHAKVSVHDHLLLILHFATSSLRHARHPAASRSKIALRNRPRHSHHQLHALWA